MGLCVFCLLSSLWPVSGSVSLPICGHLAANQPTNQPPSQLSGSEAGYRTRPQLHLFHAGWLHRAQKRRGQRYSGICLIDSSLIVGLVLLHLLRRDCMRPLVVKLDNTT
ncbi:hypothetical protein NQZ68_033327 [Dissostichus eleginoides]|nr:hypothetical protein NQZ68_033327 [Dissostichus eleginoides]